LFLEGSSGTIHRSTDEGKTWKPVSDIKDPIVVIVSHPFAKGERAFAMTAGTKHYLTTDKGQNWKPFETDLIPAFENGKGGLGFHAEEKDWILFRGTKCVKMDWFENCHDEVS
jgi:photosystem II stability/assembly factor-like uncharacterized protein